MKKLLTTVEKNLKKLSFFDKLLVALFFLIAAAVFTFFFRKTSYITVRVRVTERDVIWAYSNPPSWYVTLFKKGMKEKNSLGITTAEITDVYFYNSLTQTDDVMQKKTIYLTIRLRTTYNKRSGEYKYNGSNVSVGEALKINFGTMLVFGLVTDVEGLVNPYKAVYPVVRVQIKEANSVYLGTSGTDQFIADSLHDGDTIVDSRGQVVVEVLKKEVYPAKTITFDSWGVPHEYVHPLKKDIYLTIRIMAKQIANELYYFDEFALKVGSYIPLNFPTLNVKGQIAEITLADVEQ